MVDGGKVLFYIAFEYITLFSIFSIIFSQKTCQSVKGKMRSLSLSACTVVIDQMLFQVWSQNVVT